MPWNSLGTCQQVEAVGTLSCADSNLNVPVPDCIKSCLLPCKLSPLGSISAGKNIKVLNDSYIDCKAGIISCD